MTIVKYFNRIGLENKYLESQGKTTQTFSFNDMTQSKPRRYIIELTCTMTFHPRK